MVRELDEVASNPDIDCELMSLFPPVRWNTTVHPAAEPWRGRLRRPRTPEAIRAMLWWLSRSPSRLLGSLGTVVIAYCRRPALLVRALATVPVAAAHARTVADRGVDRLHAHTATYPLLAAWLCHRLTGVPYSFTAHAHDILMDQSFLRRRLAAADFAVAISDFNRGFLAAYGGDRATPVYVIRCGIDLPAYRFRPRAPNPDGPVRALCVAGLKDYKGHRFLFEALAGADSGLARVSVDLVGDGPLRRELEQLVHELGLDSRVRFHGSLPEAEVRALLDAADLFALPSVITPSGVTEGLPVVLVEAMAAGVPVVATRVAAVPELITHEETGLLAEPGNAEELRAAIRRLLEDPSAAARRAEAARSLVERDYDVKRSAATLARLFRDGTPYSVDGRPGAATTRDAAGAATG